MPTNRRKLLRGRVRYDLTLAELTIPELICLMRGWYPGESAAVRWTTWAEFLDIADAVHGELLTDPTIRKIYGQLVPFSVRYRRDCGPGQVFDLHGGWPGHSWPALRHAHFYTVGDNHEHEEPRLAPGQPAEGKRQ